MQTKQEQLFDALSGLDNDVVKVVTITEPKVLKKSRETGQPTPENLIGVKKYAVREHQFIGANYEKMIKKLRFKEASIIGKVKKLILGDKFKAQGTYAFPVNDNHSIFEHAKTHRKYLRTLSPKDAPVTSRYYDAGNYDITDDWKDIQDEYFAKPSPNKSQGLEEPVIVNNTTLSNVKYIEIEETGEVIYNELSERILKKLGVR